MVFQLNLDL
jgi:membrane protein involved in colicin uptake